ncbi:MAG: FRG domain-containing protein [Caldilineaceae bacterium SB0662_bin_9]|uniref:FRG domain-containing protein n=1 Tax=Caldilineaceae bacterium SB0662_bin_9 TaxID=2605258 RepID=A0A6B1DRI2_9CHLR|nr:FRG domain-containing protein [Caldilineaceae bacterium SB0662_bin_9]
MTDTNSATELNRPTWQQTWFDLQCKAIELMDGAPERTVVFRGETDYKPNRTIKPRLVRQLEADGENLDGISDLGQYLDDKEMELRWKVSHHLSSPKDRYDRKLEIEQISHSGKAVDTLKVLMQHYDIPTTLIDFTYDLNVALYFACYMHLDQDGLSDCSGLWKNPKMASSVTTP